MKRINAAATKVFEKLIATLGSPGDSRVFDKHDYATKRSGIMSVYVDFISRQEVDGVLVQLYSVAHRFRSQSGDFVADPDVTFYVVRDAEGRISSVSPLAIEHGALGQPRKTYVELNDRMRPVRWNPSGQRDLATFCGMWMSNIKHQQEL